MKEQFNLKRLVAITLVVANIFASAGFAVLANSVPDMVYYAATHEKELKTIIISTRRKSIIMKRV